MKIFQPKYQAQNGKTKKVQTWYIGFTDNARIRRRLPCYGSKTATERAARLLSDLLGATGPLAGDVARWLEEIPAAMRNRLVEWGVIDSRKWSANLGKRLSEHLCDYAEALQADNRKEGHVKETTRAVRFVLDGCGFQQATDIDSHKVKTFLAKGRGPAGYGERVYNANLVAFKGFCAWLWRQGRAVGVNPMADVDKIQQTEFRKRRRPLTDDEAARLLRAAESGPPHRHVDGRERALIYTLAMQSGLRAGEIHSLTVASFNFTADPAIVHVEASDSKGKKSADLVLVPETARAIQKHLAGKRPQDRAFHMPLPKNACKMLQEDLEAAKIPYTDASGRDADFHSLRHTFITNLARAGVHPAVAQKLARHSSIELTMKYYTHVLRESEIDAMNRLAGLSRACFFGVQTRTLADAGGRKTGDIESKTALSA